MCNSDRQQSSRGGYELGFQDAFALGGIALYISVGVSILSPQIKMTLSNDGDWISMAVGNLHNEEGLTSWSHRSADLGVGLANLPLWQVGPFFRWKLLDFVLSGYSQVPQVESLSNVCLLVWRV
jgi:hypothetical protein